jgi:hypothetical protein
MSTISEVETPVPLCLLGLVEDKQMMLENHIDLSEETEFYNYLILLPC